MVSGVLLTAMTLDFVDCRLDSLLPASTCCTSASEANVPVASFQLQQSLVQVSPAGQEGVSRGPATVISVVVGTGCQSRRDDISRRRRPRLVED